MVKNNFIEISFGDDVWEEAGTVSVPASSFFRYVLTSPFHHLSDKRGVYRLFVLKCEAVYTVVIQVKRKYPRHVGEGQRVRLHSRHVHFR
jgi:hypothetical protein